MRVTIHIPDDLEKDVKAAASENNTSVSSFIAEATRTYIQAEKRRIHGNKILDIIKTAHVTPDALNELDRERDNDDRI